MIYIFFWICQTVANDSTCHLGFTPNKENDNLSEISIDLNDSEVVSVSFEFLCW